VVLHPTAPLPLFLGYRLAIMALLLAVHRMSGRAGVPVGRLAAAQGVAFVVVATCISLMGLHLGGTRSPYMHGISIVVLVHAASMSEPWRRSLRTLVPIGLVYPVVMGAAALVHPAEGRQWFDAQAMGVFAANYVFVLASSVVAVAAGHTVWAARQQVYRARRLGRYRLQAPLGKGATGEVWLAWDSALRRNLALKILRLGGASDADRIGRFEREAFATSRLRVAHTIQIHDYGASDDGVYYIAMEYLPGTDLQSHVQSHGPMAWDLVVRLALQACLSLEEAHEAGIVHRDIKPQNLFLTRVGSDDRFLKVLDFGLARVRTQATDAQLTYAGLLIGTPAYLAPELWQGAPADVRTDIYALGATMYFLLAGTTPFDGGNAEEMMLAHLTEEPTPLHVRAGVSVPEGLSRVVQRCLAKEAPARFASIRELRDALLDTSGKEAAPATDPSAPALLAG